MDMSTLLADLTSIEGLPNLCSSVATLDLRDVVREAIEDVDGRACASCRSLSVIFAPFAERESFSRSLGFPF